MFNDRQRITIVSETHTTTMKYPMLNIACKLFRASQRGDRSSKTIDSWIWIARSYDFFSVSTITQLSNFSVITQRVVVIIARFSCLLLLLAASSWRLFGGLRSRHRSKEPADTCIGHNKMHAFNSSYSIVIWLSWLAISHFRNSFSPAVESSCLIIAFLCRSVKWKILHFHWF